MSLLSSLVRAYDRLPDAPAFGYVPGKISFAIVLRKDGTVAEIVDLREKVGKKPEGRELMVPAPAKRTSGVAPSYLWDKSSYVLGVDGQSRKLKDITDEETRKREEEKEAVRIARHVTAFRQRQIELTSGSDDVGLAALRVFLTSWQPEMFEKLGWPDDMKGSNIVFALEADGAGAEYIHDRPAAKAIWAKLADGDDASDAVGRCIVTGEIGPIARLHPSLKNVWGAQSSGASLVSFNLDSAESFGKKQGDNAPVSERAAFAYGAVLNRFLEADSGHRIQIGDTSTVFWADASDRRTASEAEALFAEMFDARLVEGQTERVEASKIRHVLEQVSAGVRAGEIAPVMADGVRFHIVGLAPNAARVSVRFLYSDSFGALAENYGRFLSDMKVEPSQRAHALPLWRYAIETAVLKKRENVNPRLAGEWMRSIISGRPYPATLLPSVITRIRADGEVNALRVSMLKAVLVRNYKKENTPVAIDRSFKAKGYLLGRLFAVYERIQAEALGANVNATIKDRFFSSASAQPSRIFGLLAAKSQTHLSKIGKTKRGYRVRLEKDVAEIIEAMSPGLNPFPTTLAVEEQALFALGYYHQKNAYFSKTEPSATEGE